MSRIDHIELFAAVVEEGTFTAAADCAGVSKSHVSNQISELEERLGVRLLQRTTRSVDPTPEGEAYYERIRQVLDDLDEAERALRQTRTEPMGTLRLTAPVDLGINYLSPMLGDFLDEHDPLKLDVDLSDRKVDLVDEGYDLAVRVGTLEDSDLIVRKIADVESYVCASPGYLEEHGEPEHPSELEEHDCVLYRYLPADGTWRFESPESIEVDIDGPIEANNGTILADAAARGAGFVMAPSFILADHLREGRLERVLTDWSHSSGAIWALYPHRRHLSAKVRVFIEYLQEQFDPPPWRDER